MTKNCSSVLTVQKKGQSNVIRKSDAPLVVDQQRGQRRNFLEPDLMASFDPIAALHKSWPFLLLLLLLFVPMERGTRNRKKINLSDKYLRNS